MVRLALITLLTVLGLVVVAGLVLALQFVVAIGMRRRALRAVPVGPDRTDLPPKIADFAMRGLAGDSPAAAVRIKQQVEMIRAPGADWSPMRARHLMSAGTSAFVWVARQDKGILPLVRVLDAYDPTRGGVLAVRLFGAFPVGTMRGAEMDRAEAMRYLAELPWFPDAILSNGDIRWSETTDGVEASLSTKGGDAQVAFTFDSAGDITTMIAKDRPAQTQEGAMVNLDWKGTMSDYGIIGARRVPRQVEVGYIHDIGYAAYFRGWLTEYDLLR